MAEFTACRNNALPYPVYGLPYVVSFPLLDADGDPISPSSPDSEISKNGDTFADCTNEAVEIATSSGICYLSLTGTELTTDLATVRIQSTGAKTTVLSITPRKLVSILAGTAASAGSLTSTIVLDSGASAVDDFYNGMIVAAVIDGTTEVRMITDYTGSSKSASVTPDWNTAPDSDDTFTIYRPDGSQIQQVNVTHINSTAQTARDIGASVLLSVGTGAGQVNLSSGKVPATIAAGDLAADSLTASALATDAVNEIRNAITGGAYALSTDSNGMIRIVDGTGTGEINTASGSVPVTGTVSANLISIAGVTQDDKVGENFSTFFHNGGGFTTVVVDDIASGGGLDAAGVRAAIGLASANLDTQLTAIDDYLDTEIAAIKAKTDQLTFTTSNRVDCQVFGMQTDVITATAVAASAVSEIQSGLSTLDASGVRTAIGMASANLDTQLAALAGYIDTEVASILAAVDTEVAAIKAKTDNLPAAPAATGDVTGVWTTAMTESYAADGATMTPAQALYMIWAAVNEFVIVGTTITAYKLNGSTAAMTWTMDDATNPTSRTRAT